jgi:AcrR family transcriptional regulator
MPRTPEENKRIREERKAQILSAALTVFAENGLAAAKMSDIAKAAGVSYGLVYRYFPSKEQLFVELVNDSLSSSQELIKAIRDLHLSPLERMKETFTQLFNYHASDPGGGLFFRVMLQLNFHPHLWEQLVIKDLTSEPVFQFLYETIIEGQQSGEFVDTNPQEIVLLLGYLAISFSLRGHEMFNDELNVENITNLIVRMIKK